MLKTIPPGRETTRTGTDPALKPRLRLRTRSEYAGWILSILLGIGILTSVLTNPNYKWGVVAQYFTHESILRGLMLTIFLTVASMTLGTSALDPEKVGEVLTNPQEPRTQAFLEKVL